MVPHTEDAIVHAKEGQDLHKDIAYELGSTSTDTRMDGVGGDVGSMENKYGRS